MTISNNQSVQPSSFTNAMLYLFCIYIFVFFLGRAIKHVKESIFTPEGGARRGIPKVLVVLTDGRSQDDVNKVSKEMQMEGTYFRI